MYEIKHIIIIKARDCNYIILSNFLFTPPLQSEFKNKIEKFDNRYLVNRKLDFVKIFY